MKVAKRTKLQNCGVAIFWVVFLFRNCSRISLVWFFFRKLFFPAGNCVSARQKKTRKVSSSDATLHIFQTFFSKTASEGFQQNCGGANSPKVSRPCGFCSFASLEELKHRNVETVLENFGDDF